MRRERLLNLRHYRRNPKARARLYARIYGRRALWKRNLKARYRKGLRSWFAALFAAVFARQIADRYVTRQRPIEVVQAGRKVAGPRRRVYKAGGRKLGGFARLWRLRVADRNELRFAIGASEDDKRRMRNARKQEARIAREVMR